MAKHSWPTAVTSWEDIVKFAQLLFGTDVRYENYSDRLPVSSNESFLLFAKGASKAPRPFSEVATVIPAQLPEIKEYEIVKRGNHSNPLKSQQMLSRHKRVHYASFQVTRSRCGCGNVFGADAHQDVIPTPSALWNAGSRFGELLDQILKTNFAGIQAMRPSWLMKTWQAVWNSNDHNQGNGIEPHSDFCQTYVFGDPITSFSFGRGGVLRLKSTTGKGLEKMLFQEDGDVLVMAGKFQAEYLHGVPIRSSWDVLMKSPGFTMLKDWEKQGMKFEEEGHKHWNGTGPHFRWNCTLRWHHGHWPGCAEYQAVSPVTPGASSQLAAVSSPVLSGSGLQLAPKALSGIRSVW